MAKAKANGEPKAKALTSRELNRATLARQLLLERAQLPVAEAVGRLAAVQSQWPSLPYLALWARLAGFERKALAKAIDDREVVRATLIRGTLHLARSADFLRFRSVVQPALDRGFEALPEERRAGLDYHGIEEAACDVLKKGPATAEALREAIERRFPKVDVRMAGHWARLNVPLVQVPEAGTTWGYASDPKFALASEWLGKKIAPGTDPKDLVRSYLAAFGPASVRDAESWTGLKKLAPAFEALRPELQTFTDEAGKVLFDLADAPRPAAETEAPPRLLPEFDAVVMGHQDRTRIVPDAHRKLIYLSALRVRATLLFDGAVRGAWRIVKKRKVATLTVELFEPVKKKDRAPIAAEAESLAKLIEPGCTSFEVAFEEPS